LFSGLLYDVVDGRDVVDGLQGVAPARPDRVRQLLHEQLLPSSRASRSSGPKSSKSSKKGKTTETITVIFRCVWVSSNDSNDSNTMIFFDDLQQCCDAMFGEGVGPVGSNCEPISSSRSVKTAKSTKGGFYTVIVP
jgi:hypothetical protein